MREAKKSKVEQLLHLKLWQALLVGVVLSVSIMVCSKNKYKNG